MLVRLSRWLLVALAVAFVVVILASLLRTGFAFWWFSDFARWGSATLGLEEHSAVLFAVTMTAIVTLVGPFFIGFIFLGRYRLIVAGISVALAMMTYGVIYTVGDDVYFDQRSGKPLRYYADTASGIRFSRSPGYDPKFGPERKAVTPEIIASLENERNGVRPKQLAKGSITRTEAFGSADGRPRIWVFRNPSSGDLELFDGPGFHPHFRQPLQPITPEQVASLLEISKQQLSMAEEKKRKQGEIESAEARRHYIGHYINTASRKATGKDLTIVLVDQAGNIDERNSEKIAARLRTKNYSVNTSLLKPQFVGDGIFARISSGEYSELGKLGLSEFTDYVALGKRSITFKTSPELQGLVRAEIEFNLKIFSAKTGASEKAYLLSGVGAGFNEAAAEAQAVEDALRRF